MIVWRCDWPAERKGDQCHDVVVSPAAVGDSHIVVGAHVLDLQIFYPFLSCVSCSAVLRSMLAASLWPAPDFVHTDSVCILMQKPWLQLLWIIIFTI